MMRSLFAFIALALLCACATFPDLPDSFSAQSLPAGYPDLRPIDPRPEPDAQPETEAALKARAAALQAEADRLRNHSR